MPIESPKTFSASLWKLHHHHECHGHHGLTRPVPVFLTGVSLPNGVPLDDWNVGKVSVFSLVHCDQVFGHVDKSLGLKHAIQEIYVYQRMGDDERMKSGTSVIPCSSFVGLSSLP